MKPARVILIGLATLYLALTAEAATPEGWAGFYKPSAPSIPQRSVVATASSDPSSVCLSAIMDAQARHGIPDNLLLAIGIQEAGRKIGGQLTVWPWTANSDGRGAFFESKQALEAWVRETQTRGQRSIDVGCMQVNQKWHAQHFASLEQATEPNANVDYAARFLRGLYDKTGNWWEAAGRYHSSTQEYKDIYLRKLAHNQRLANTSVTEYAVLPKEPAPAAPAPRRQPGIHWSADMTGSGAQVMRQVVSIYSATPLQPILPGYAEAD